MTKIVVEFATPKARQNARFYRKKIVEAIDRTLESLKDGGGNIIFFQHEYSVNMTFEEGCRPSGGRKK